jgi:hypothetical protein
MSDTLGVEDVLALQKVVALYSHLVDSRDWEGLSAVFTEDSIFDLSGSGLPRLEGLDALRRFFSTLEHPLAHHTTNLVIESDAADVASLRSKALVVFEGGRAGSAEYHDDAVRTAQGWRLAVRTVVRMVPEIGGDA